MKKKQEINISVADARNILIAIFLPFILLFIIEHFGEFKYIGYGGVSISEARVSSITFNTPFGNKIYEDLSSNNVGYERQSNGNWVINGGYASKLPYYVKGLIKDIIYPIILMIILLSFVLLSLKYKLKFSSN
ncbi:hypothetical protein F3C99_11300 [Vitellibacter sp. q18]|nr:hypothetical protein [Aequorivita lutea]